MKKNAKKKFHIYSAAQPGRQWLNPALVKAAREDHIEAYEKLERRDMIEEENGNIRIKVDLVRGWLVNGK